jgi:septal ring factor EnvC (AmiA/AmiB activator)
MPNSKKEKSMSKCRMLPINDAGAFSPRRESTEAVKSTVQMGKQVREEQQKLQKQKDRLLRELKRAENKRRHAEDELSSAKMSVEKLQLRVSSPRGLRPRLIYILFTKLGKLKPPVRPLDSASSCSL